jgi:hypothetical protein
MRTEILRVFTLFFFLCLIVGCGSSSSTGGKTQNSKMRLINYSWDLPKIDLEYNFQRVFQDVPYGEPTQFVNVKSGSNTSTIFNEDYPTSIISGSLSVRSNNEYDFIYFSSTTSPRLISLPISKTKAELGRAKVRFAQFLPRTFNLSAYIISDRNQLDSINPTFKNISSGDSSNYVEIAPGSYELVVFNKKQQEELIAQDIVIESGDISSIYVHGNDELGLPIEITVFNDSSNS